MQILFFAEAKRAAGGRCGLLLTVDEPIDGGEIWRRLIATFPELAAIRPMTRLARNGTFASPGEQFHPGDEVALIPPVSGG